MTTRGNSTNKKNNSSNRRNNPLYNSDYNTFGSKQSKIGVKKRGSELGSNRATSPNGDKSLMKSTTLKKPPT